ncbi:TPA: ATP-binding protein [Candidatus Micrarchaeota archaeon]|nr:ATP-binding protein [Candidatus Micrarchaeota archaeon]
MNTFIQFVNRKNELEFLEMQIKRSSSLVVLYGRRRVGKSELIKHFIKDKNAIYLLAAQEVEQELLGSFSQDIAAYFNDPTLKTNPFLQFKQLLENLKERKLRNLVLIIDEFPYLVDANKAIPSLLQKYWDLYFKSSGFHIILCGSSIGAMETEVLGRKSPLYGRRTGQWKLDPLQFKHFLTFFSGSEFEKMMELYSISGGIPLYILEFEKGKTTYENAKDAIARRGSILYQEADIILKEELREPKTYFSLLKEISAGKNTLNELANALGTERTALVRYIDTLKNLDLIDTIKPITAKEKSKNTLYILKDNYFKFWFGFVYPFKKELDSFRFDGFRKNFEEKFNAYVGRQFEQICRESLIGNNPINSTEVGSWWGSYRDKQTNERKTAEIDIVAINKETKEILFAECKWQDGVNARKILTSLQEKTKLVEWNNTGRKEYFAVFAKSFAKKENLGENILLFDLKDLKGIFR